MGIQMPTETIEQWGNWSIENIRYLEEIGIIDLEQNPFLDEHNPYALERLAHIVKDKPEDQPIHTFLADVNYEQAHEVCSPDDFEAVYADDFIGSTKMIREHGNEGLEVIAEAQAAKLAFVRWFNKNHGEEFGRLQILNMPGDGQIIAGSVTGVMSLNQMMQGLNNPITMSNGETINLRRAVRKTVLFNPRLSDEDNNEDWLHSFIAVADESEDDPNTIVVSNLNTRGALDRSFQSIKKREEGFRANGELDLVAGDTHYPIPLTEQIVQQAPSIYKDQTFATEEDIAQLDKVTVTSVTIADDFLRSHTEDGRLREEVKQFVPSPDTVAIVTRDRDDSLYQDDHKDWQRQRTTLQHFVSVAEKDVTKYSISREGSQLVLLITPTHHEAGTIRSRILHRAIEAKTNHELEEMDIAISSGSTYQASRTIISPDLHQISKALGELDASGPPKVCISPNIVPEASMVANFATVGEGIIIIEKSPFIVGESKPDIFRTIGGNLDALINPRGISIIQNYATLLELSLTVADEVDEETPLEELPEPLQEVIRKQNVHIRSMIHTWELYKALGDSERVLHESRIRYQHLYRELQLPDELKDIGERVSPQDFLSFFKHFEDQVIVTPEIAKALGFGNEAEMLQMIDFLNEEGLVIYTTRDLTDGNLEQRVLILPDFKESGIVWSDASELAQNIIDYFEIPGDESPQEKLKRIKSIKSSQSIELIAYAERIKNPDIEDAEITESAAVVLALIDKKFQEGLSHPYTIDQLIKTLERLPDSEDYFEIRRRLQLHILRAQFDDLNHPSSREHAQFGRVQTNLLNIDINTIVGLTAQITELAEDRKFQEVVSNDPIALEIIYRSAERIRTLMSNATLQPREVTTINVQIKSLMDLFHQGADSKNQSARRMYESLSIDLTKITFTELQKRWKDIKDKIEETGKLDRPQALLALRIADQMFKTAATDPDNSPPLTEALSEVFNIYSYLSQNDDMAPDLMTRYGANLTQAKFIQELKSDGEISQRVSRINDFITQNLIYALKTREKRLIFLALNNFMAVSEALIDIDHTEVNISSTSLTRIANEILKYDGSPGRTNRNRESRFPGNSDIMAEFCDSLVTLLKYFASEKAPKHQRIEPYDQMTELLEKLRSLKPDSDHFSKEE